MVLSAVLSDNEHATSIGLAPFDNEDVPHGTRTPPTLPSRSPPPASPLPDRVRAVAQIQPVSIPEIVRDMAGKKRSKNWLISVVTTYRMVCQMQTCL